MNQETKKQKQNEAKLLIFNILDPFHWDHETPYNTSNSAPPHLFLFYVFIPPQIFLALEFERHALDFACTSSSLDRGIFIPHNTPTFLLG